MTVEDCATWTRAAVVHVWMEALSLHDDAQRAEWVRDQFRERARYHETCLMTVAWWDQHPFDFSTLADRPGEKEGRDAGE